MRVETPSGHAILHEGWHDGKVALLSRGDTHFCIGCFLTLVLDSSKSSLFKIGVSLEENISELKLFKPKYGAIRQGETITYVLNLTNYEKFYSKEFLEDENVHLQIIPYAGDVRVYVNPKHAVTNESALFVHEEAGVSEIIIQA